jgi:hypothetical protein
VNALLGYDQTPLLGTKEPGLIGDDGIPVSAWVRLLESAGFRTCDILLRNTGKIVVASAKP